jgi:hypothetical protein
MFYEEHARISSLNAMILMNRKDGPRLRSWSSVRCTLLNKDNNLCPNSIIMTKSMILQYPYFLNLLGNKKEIK